jgi:peptidoglycan hydrolase CwlO-like protein
MTNRLSRGLGIGAVTALLTVGVATGVASTATADDAGTGSAPCATQQTQVDKATAKLADLQAVFNHEKRDLKKAQHALANAHTAKAKKHAKTVVADEQSDVATAAKAKKAQVQRLAHAQARLNDCLAASSTPSPSPAA